MSEGGILIVEDTQASLKLLSGMLAEQGYKVRTAQSGERALVSVAAKLPDLILLDIRMPGIDGFDVLAQLKAQERTRDIPVIILSALTDRESRLEGLKLGAIDFLSKPYQREELLAKVHTHMELVRARTSLERMAEELRQANEQIQIAFSDERKQAAAAMEENRRFLSDIIENSGLLIFAKDREGRYLMVNGKFEESTGLSREQVLGNTDEMIFPSAIGRQFRANDLEVMESGVTMEKEEMLESEQGMRTFLSTKFALRDNTGKVVGLCGMTTEISERKHTEAALREYASQLEKLSRYALEAQETERRRLAIELHDELGQALTAIKINLQGSGRFTGQTAEEINAENIGIVDNVLQQVRRLALALRPSMLDDLGLLSALRWLAEQTEARADLAIVFHASHFQLRLAPEIETACFRIVQEALTNIVRHAQAQQVAIDLSHDADTLLLCVQDDGCGFDPVVECKRALAGDSMGVLGMQERAALIGGRLDVQSTPGQGSRVSLSCPMRFRGEAA